MEALAQSLVWILLHAATGERLTIDRLADELARNDVVFVGEEHDNPDGHRFQLALIEELHRRRPDLVVSMEMFERDVQGVLDDYLRGRIDEATFRAHARPWGDYEKHYRPIVELARERGLDVIAANAPRNLARRVATGDLEFPAGQPGCARSTSAPRDAYYERFKDAMKDHVGAEGDEALERMYRSQCLKDDTMAEAITDYLDQRPHRRPLVVHLTGKFHSDFGQGTVWRVLKRRPLVHVAVVSMVALEDPEKADPAKHREVAHFVVAVPAVEKPPSAPVAAAKPEPDGEAAAAAGDEAATPASPEPAEPDAGGGGGGRAALGIMPDYGATDPGVTVAAVTPGGAAEKAGLEAGDRIVRIAKERVEDLQEYMEVLETHRAGQTVEITFSRDGKEQKTKVKLQTSHR